MTNYMFKNIQKFLLLGWSLNKRPIASTCEITGADTRADERTLTISHLVLAEEGSWGCETAVSSAGSGK